MTNNKNYLIHYNLFRFLLKGKLTLERFSNHHINECRLEGNDFLIRFSTLENESFNRGWKCHFALDLTDSEKFKEVAIPMTIIKSYLNADKWKDLLQ